MSIAPWWWGIIMAAKSLSTSPVGITSISFIIFVIAASFSLRKGASSAATTAGCCAAMCLSWAKINDDAANAKAIRAPNSALPTPGLRNRNIGYLILGDSEVDVADRGLFARAVIFCVHHFVTRTVSGLM